MMWNLQNVKKLIVRNTKIFSVFTLIFIVLTAIVGESSSKTVEPAFLKASNEFSSDLYSKFVVGNTGSVIFSPASIQQVLTMLSFGAVGQTKDELMAGLKYPADFTSDDVQRNCKTLIENVKSSKFLKMANKIFVKNGVQVQPAFDEISRKVFGTETQALDFGNSQEAAKTINDWIEAQTNHKIKDAVSPDYLDDNTSMVLVNAIYFLGNWKHQFDPENTQKGIFYNFEMTPVLEDTSKVDFMRLRNVFKYAVLPKLSAAAIQLKYKNSNIAMLIILPNSKTGLPLVEKALQSTAFGDIVKAMKPKPVDLSLPKFQIETEVELSNALKDMGMTTMFTENANFSAMMMGGARYSISKVLHKAFIEVNEVGTEAAAATSAIAPTSEDLDEVFFTANRPFFFAIFNGDGIYFSGRVTRF